MAESPLAPILDPDDWLDVGQIVSAQGLQGEVRIYPDSDFPERFENPGQRWLQRSKQAEPERVQLIRGRFLAAKNLYVVKFAGVDTREQAEALRGAKLLVPATDRPSLAPGEFHLQDLVGLTVINQQNQAIIGRVIGLIYAGNTLLEVKTEVSTAETILIPFVEALVPVVDLTVGRLEVSPIPGLLP
jgi:16S rRNA processing protein RimM